ncbi:MFS transporter [Kribbella sp. NPDC026611]|uniref:MFS transporter n=1 Tax=Kribbella sp. NPDC026611 TaxID=3154911 RepID=UPI0033F1CD56
MSARRSSPPGSLAIIEAVFRPEDRSRAIGAWSGPSGVGAPRSARWPEASWSTAVGVVGLVAFVVRERTADSPMLPLSVFASRQFTAANLVTFAVYGALGGVMFLFVIFLQVSLGYSALEAGAATLPITAAVLVLSPPMGALAQRIGPRLPLSVGPALLAAGALLMTRLDGRSTFIVGVLPAVVVFGLGLGVTVAPVTATALATVDDRHAGVASGVNNAVSRVAGLVTVAGLLLLTGLSGSDLQRAQQLEDGFASAMLITACLAATLLGATIMSPERSETSVG